MKQDFEILTRILEYKAGVAKVGKQPQMKHAPPGSKQFYGDLNSVAHPSNPHLLASLTKQHIEGDIAGVSSCPVFIHETARTHYEFHVWITLEVAREALVLATEMYDSETDKSDILFAMQMFLFAVELLKSVGFSIEE